MAGKTPSRSRGEQEVRAEQTPFERRVVLPAQAYIHTESLGGGVLLAAAVLALAWANSPWAESYFRIRDAKLTLDLGLFAIEESLQHWVNDGLMVIFFFVVGLEVKREFVHGELSSARKAALPVAAAAAGMAVPASIYAAINFQGGDPSGWGVPVATDIAFALGVLALLGDRVPKELRIFLLTLATIDDIGAILIIAFFYAHDISWLALGIAAGLLAVLFLMKRWGVTQYVFYILVGVLFWAAVQQSGVHATIAGVILGVLTPAVAYLKTEQYRTRVDRLVARFADAHDKGEAEHAGILLGRIEELTRGTEAPLDRLLRKVHPWSSFVVLPVFALFNAGVAMDADLISKAATSPVTWGVFVGLVVGKVVGSLLGAWGAVSLGIAELPHKVHWRHIGGVGMLAGIGFTVSLFIAELAFDGESSDATSEAKIGILAASLLAGVLGYLGLRLVSGVGERDGDEPGRESRSREDEESADGEAGDAREVESGRPGDRS